MPTTTAPLLSFGASGQIAKAHVYSKWKGRSYVRRYQVPTYSRTDEQDKTRTAFSFLNSVYKVAPSLFIEPWSAYALGKVLTDRNAFLKFNLPLLRPASTLDDFVGSPGALGGLPATGQVITPGSGSLSVAISVPSVLPQGWTIYSAVTAIIREQDPQSGVLYNITAAEDTTATYTNAFSSLGAHDWQVLTWLKWTRPDGKTAYSPSIQSQATST